MDADGVRATVYFHMPDEVVYAQGVTLIDITDYLYNYGSEADQVGDPIGTPTTYSNGTGKLLTFTDDLLMNDSITAMVEPGTGNTDGFDLDAISEYKYNDWRTADTATGLGTPILSKSTWFMYNYYDGSVIGSYTVEMKGTDMYTVNYGIAPTIEVGGYLYDIVVKDEHLGISDSMSFKAKPGVDDNQDFGTSFMADDEFYIFAHFSVEYR